MSFTFLERLILLGVLPEKGSFITLNIIKHLREQLAPSSEEIKEMNIVEYPETGNVTWDVTKETSKEIIINPVILEMIKKKLKDMDSKEELTPQHMSLYEKICV